MRAAEYGVHDQIELAGRGGGRPIPGRTRRTVSSDWAATALLALVAHHRSVPIHLLLHPSRGRAAVAEARQLAMYLTHVALGRPLVDVGRFFGRDRTTVAYACAHIEDLRDRVSFDTEVSRLEAQVLSHLQQTEPQHEPA